MQPRHIPTPRRTPDDHARLLDEDRTPLPPPRQPVAMSTVVRRLGQLGQVLGAVGLVGSVGWWYDMYGRIPEGASCLYQQAFHCDLLAVAASLRGYVPYTPLALWGSVAVLIGSAVLVVCTKPTR